MTGHRIDIKTRIIGNAEMEFAEKGYEGTSVRDIAERADTNVAVIYYHFRSKELLYKTLFSMRLAQLTKALQDNEPDRSGTSFDQFDSYVHVYIRKIKENFYFHRLLNAEIFSFRDRFFKFSIRESIQKNTTLFRRVIQEGIDKNEFRPVDIDLFLMTLFHLLHQVIGRSPLVSEILNLEEIPEERMLQRITDLVHRLLDLDPVPENHHE